MAINPKLHEKLIGRQPSEEIKRKAIKAKSKSIWTQEDADWVTRRAVDHIRRKNETNTGRA